MAKVSVIIPAYNQGHYLAEAVESVLEQTYQDFEIVIVNDGSTDNTAEVADSFDDPRVRTVYQPNAGLSAARNTGLRHASGEFVSFLDSDDRFLPQNLELLGGHLEANPETGFVAGRTILIDREGKPLERTVRAGLPEDKAELLLGNPVQVGCMMLRRSWLDQVEPFDESLRACEDWDLWLRLAQKGCRMDSIDQPVFLYRMHGDQMTSDAPRMRKAMLTTLDKVYGSPVLPSGWLEMKDRAYAAIYMKAAARAYRQGAFDDARRDLAQGLRLDPSYLENGARKLGNHLLGWASASRTMDPMDYLERVYQNLPEEAAILRRRRRRELAQLGVQLAFEAYKKSDLARARSALLRAVRYRPAWLANRGVLAILARSWRYS